jgi:DNA-binding MarR family transcriptional regulator
MKDVTAHRTTRPIRSSRRLDTPVRGWLRLARSYQKISQAASDDLRREGLSIGQFDVLAHIGAAEGSTQQQIADALLVTKSNVCQLLDRMERAGSVRREQHGRTNHLYLTPEGRSLYNRVVPAHERTIARQFAALSNEEQDALLGLLRKLDHSLA